MTPNANNVRNIILFAAVCLPAKEVLREVVRCQTNSKIYRLYHNHMNDVVFPMRRPSLVASARNDVHPVVNTYLKLCQTRSDINEHLPTLAYYASTCASIRECGVRGVISSWALLAGLQQNRSVPDSEKFMILNDLFPCDVSVFEKAATQTSPDIQITCEWKNNLDMSDDVSVDITFIDTWHVYAQLKRELEKFSHTTNKYMILHDTTVDADLGETLRNGWDPVAQMQLTGFPVVDICRGLWPAVQEFLEEHQGEWTLLHRYTNNNGLTILAKTPAKL